MPTLPCSIWPIIANIIRDVHRLKGATATVQVAEALVLYPLRTANNTRPTTHNWRQATRTVRSTTTASIERSSAFHEKSRTLVLCPLSSPFLTFVFAQNLTCLLTHLSFAFCPSCSQVACPADKANNPVAKKDKQYQGYTDAEMKWIFVDELAVITVLKRKELATLLTRCCAV